MQHRIIDGRIFRAVTVEAADTRAASHHPSTAKPLSPQEQRAYQAEIGSEEYARARIEAGLSPEEIDRGWAVR